MGSPVADLSRRVPRVRAPATTWGRGAFPVRRTGGGVEARTAGRVRRVQGPEGKGEQWGRGAGRCRGPMRSERWRGDRIGKKGVGQRRGTGADLSAHAPRLVDSPLSVAPGCLLQSGRDCRSWALFVSGLGIGALVCDC